MSLNPQHLWYELVEPEDVSLQQGDILFGLRFQHPTDYIGPRPPGAELDHEHAGQISILRADVVILTASCDLDLANTSRRIDVVTLCPHWDFEWAARYPEVTGVKAS